MKTIFFISLAYLVKATQINYDQHGGYMVYNKAFHFPYGTPFMGIFLAVAIPLDLPNYDVFLSFNIESNWDLPTNQTTLYWPPVVSKRSIGRAQIYNLLENKIQNSGFPGQECLLRTICEASESQLDGHGVLGDIMNVLLSPSTSEIEVNDVYHEAEMYGKEHLHCERYTENCTTSILGLFTTLGKEYLY